MIVGFNHNILYRGVGFHVQTEDGGLKSPSLVTLLYHGGIIVTSQKTSYADILKVDNLNQVVEDLAKEQHKGMLRRLTKGEFDERILALGIKIEGAASTPAEVSEVASEEPFPVPLPEIDDTEEEKVPPAAAEEPLLGEELEELEPVPLDSPEAPDGEPRPVEESEPLTAATDDDLPPAIEPAYVPPSAEDRGAQDVSEALDDLIFSYLTGGDDKG